MSGIMRDLTAVLPRGFAAETLLAPEQAVIAFFAAAALAPPSVEIVALDAAFGRVLAAAAVAREPHPSHARSTMDGFAVASTAGRQARAVVGEVEMGRAPARVIGAFEALRIPTGGALPEGADAVIPIEDADESGAEIVPRRSVAAGESVTQPGEDIAAGETALEAGRRIGGPELGLLATLGITQVQVYRRPRFAVVSSGDELVPPDRTPGPGQVRDSNRYAIAGTLQALGAEPVHFPRVRDTLGALRDVLAVALEGCDAVTFTGGSSVGARDLTPRVVADFGTPGVLVHGLRVKPGKPTFLGAIAGKPVIGLPGNPASAQMILEAVVRPIVAACTGERFARTTVVTAAAARPFTGRPGWTWFVPARLSLSGTQLLAEPLPLRSAHASLLARASGYVELGEASPRIEAGEPVAVTLFASGGAPAGLPRA
jgi:molybdenum cofactor synthesis domain-containing protein